MEMENQRDEEEDSRTGRDDGSALPTVLLLCMGPFE